jgi:hypothetical protein
VGSPLVDEIDWQTVFVTERHLQQTNRQTTQHSNNKFQMQRKIQYSDESFPFFFDECDEQLLSVPSVLTQV